MLRLKLKYLGLREELAGLDPGARLVDEHRHPVAHLLHQLLHCNDALLPERTQQESKVRSNELSELR